jgi:nicotinamide riboside kinase
MARIVGSRPADSGSNPDVPIWFEKMKIAIIGSHGTGKTTLLDYLKKDYPGFKHYGDIFRDIAKKTGYLRPRSIFEESGISVLVGAALGEYSDLETYANVLLDQGPVVMMAYYYAHSDEDNKFLIKLAKYYSDMIDFYIYLPVNTIPLISDDMRPVELDFQQKVDLKLKEELIKMGIPKKKVYAVKSLGIQERVEEVGSIIKRIMKNEK